MKILFTEKNNLILKELLKSKGHVCVEGDMLSENEIRNVIKDYDGIIVRSRVNIDKEFIDEATRLRFIARAGSGTENINCKYASEKNILCLNAGEGNGLAVAEHSLAMLLNLFNNISISNN